MIAGRPYFVVCFICGSDYDNCGHREPELIGWWRAQNPVYGDPAYFRALPPPGIRQIPEAQQPRPAIADTSDSTRTVWRTSGHDNAKLERGRMPWPKNRVTPEIALALKR